MCRNISSSCLQPPAVKVVHQLQLHHSQFSLCITWVIPRCSDRVVVITSFIHFCAQLVSGARSQRTCCVSDDVIPSLFYYSTQCTSSACPSERTWNEVGLQWVMFYLQLLQLFIRLLRRRFATKLQKLFCGRRHSTWLSISVDVEETTGFTFFWWTSPLNESFQPLSCSLSLIQLQ